MDTVSNLDLNSLASKHFGVPNLTDAQAEAIRAALKQQHVFVYLPTAAGKTLCFTMLPLVYTEILKAPRACIVVVSPLIELMRSQATYL